MYKHVYFMVRESEKRAQKCMSFKFLTLPVSSAFRHFDFDDSGRISFLIR